MSLKHRNSIAFFLILSASLCWLWGREMMSKNSPDHISNTTHPLLQETMFSSTLSISEEHSAVAKKGTYDPQVSHESTDSLNDSPTAPTSRNTFGFILCVVGAVCAFIAIFIFWQQTPLLGPDVFCMLFGLGGTLYCLMYAQERIAFIPHNLSFLLQSMTTVNILFSCILLSALRTLWGWIRARFSSSWYFLHRAFQGISIPQLSMLLFVGWILTAVCCATYQLLWFISYHRIFPLSLWSLAATVVSSIFCLWQYAADLHHFQKQLTNYQQGAPITVGHGAFSQTEAQLLTMQTQHEEAIRTAITSERFKVELISNVSHDLRTPLTSILGYSELLQQEPLSPQGQEQLRQLQQKAGYMSDLVDSLFELTKVSSGVIEAKQEEIDLIRLLEQTIGLFDDQLNHVGLTVKRNYCADSILLLSDGSRMHQVFANLLGNAIKYALTGTRIYIEVRELSEHYRIRMVNTSSYEMDFSPEEILQRFARGDKARSTKGSGLGLAIAQTYTDSVGGNFRIAIDGDQFSAIVELPKTERNL